MAFPLSDKVHAYIKNRLLPPAFILNWPILLEISQFKKMSELFVVILMGFGCNEGKKKTQRYLTTSTLFVII